MADVELENVDVEIYSRLELLALAITQFADAFGADDDCLESIRKGVYERQILEKIILYYFDKSEDLVGMIALSIDWNVYKLKVHDENGNNFEMKASKSVLEQLDKATVEIINHVNRLRYALGVKKIECRYLYRAKYRISQEKEKEAMQYLGHSTAKPLSTKNANSIFEHTIKCVMDTLEELEITISSK